MRNWLLMTHLQKFCIGFDTATDRLQFFKKLKLNAFRDC